MKIVTVIREFIARPFLESKNKSLRCNRYQYIAKKVKTDHMGAERFFVSDSECSCLHSRYDGSW